MPEDMVNSPSHYNQSNIECIDAIRAALGEEGFVFYCRGNNIKYNWRAGHKVDAKEDLEKAAWYSRMAAGDDPRYKPTAPNLTLPTQHELMEARVAVKLTETSDNLKGMVPPECDSRSITITPCSHDLHYDAYDQYATCRKCGIQPDAGGDRKAVGGDDRVHYSDGSTD
jgi:hypothetical protein